MKFLLPHSYKKIGAVIAPTGFILWLCMQRGLITRALTFAFGENAGGQTSSAYHTVNVIIAIISFFSFLGGLYFISFSKEKIEDEMVERTRLESFQFAALVQLSFIIVFFLSLLFFNEPGDAGLTLFFLGSIILFWICFIGRFNYILHVKIRE
jgi:hypothetical protein